MTRTLEGSCQCGAVEFSVDSHTPVPYQLCVCSICRKVGGYGGSVNLGAVTKTLKIKKGEENIKYVKSILILCPLPSALCPPLFLSLSFFSLSLSFSRDQLGLTIPIIQKKIQRHLRPWQSQ